MKTISFEDFEKSKEKLKEKEVEGELIHYENSSDTVYEGDSEFFTFKTDRFSNNSNFKKYKLNETDKEIANWFIFTKNGDIFLKNPKTLICEKVEQDGKGQVNQNWIKAHIPETELADLLQSKLSYGEVTEVSSEDWTKSDMVDMLDELQAYFPLFCRVNADGVCYNGVNSQKVIFEDGEKRPTTIYKCKGTIKLVTRTKDLYDMFSNALAFYKNATNTVTSASSIAAYTNKMDIPAFHRFVMPTINEKENTHFVTNWLRMRLDENSINVLKAWIWGVYDAKNTSRQVLYVYDSDGHAGKSTFFNAVFDELTKNNLVFGTDCTSFKSNFDADSYFDKRLMLLGDNKDKNIIRYGRVHSITGGDPIKVEGKNKKSFSYVPSLKICAMGNILPEIDVFARHEATRLLIINWKLNEEALLTMAIKDENGKPKRDRYGIKVAGDSTMEDKLKENMPEFLYECKIAYDKLCINNCTIDDSAIADETNAMILSKEDLYDEFFDKYFIYTGDNKDKISASTITDTWVEYYKENKDKVNDAGLPSMSGNMIEHIIKRFSLIPKDLKPNKKTWNGPRTQGFWGITAKKKVGHTPTMPETFDDEPEYVPPTDKFNHEFDDTEDSMVAEMEKESSKE